MITFIETHYCLMESLYYVHFDSYLGLRSLSGITADLADKAVKKDTVKSVQSAVISIVAI